MEMTNFGYDHTSNGNTPLPSQSSLASEDAILKVVAPPAVTHRLAEVRQQQGVSVRSVARKMGITMQEVRAQEDPSSDLRLSDLLWWQQVLDVPLADLLVDNNAPLSPTVNQRASLLRVMKTAKALSDNVKEPKAKRMADMLVEQLVEVMPELKEVSAWHSVGQRRTQEEIGRIAEKTIPDSLFGD
ncbi:MAG: helix-turn-helix domain-containing protein [Lacipirellulaceae bacterium]